QWNNDLDCIHDFNARFLAVLDSGVSLAKQRPTRIAKIYAKAIPVNKLRSPLFQLIDDGVTDISALGSILLETATRLLRDGWKYHHTPHFRKEYDKRDSKRQNHAARKFTKPQSPAKQPLKCSHCGKLYHDADHCFILHPELRTKKLSSDTRSSDSFRIPVTLPGRINT
ncbi:hypothetical protein ADUPG1_005148, partial [Aduncisulcus paluster]